MYLPTLFVYKFAIISYCVAQANADWCPPPCDDPEPEDNEDLLEKIRNQIPAVINPPWDIPVPKFNCMIIKRMGDKDTPICSGGLITNSFVITVGQSCVADENTPLSPDDLIIRFISATAITVDKQVKALHHHEGSWHTSKYLAHNDLVIIQLESKILEENIQPVKITRRTGMYHPFIDDLWDLSNVRVYHMAVDFRDAMWFIRTRYVQPALCGQLAPPDFVSTKLTCTSYFHMGSRDCSPDQGSPLSYKGELIGLLVHKSFCGGPRDIALFVNVGLQSAWIRKTVQKLSDNEESV